MNESQERILRELLLADQEFPEVDPGLRNRIAALLEEGLAAFSLEGHEGLVVTKSALTQVHQCEGLFTALDLEAFEWSIELVAGVIAHLAIQHQHQDRRAKQPAEYVVSALEVAQVDSAVSEWLQTAPNSHRLEVKGRATTQVELWTDFWPELPETWRVRGEAPYAAKLKHGQVTLVARPDLIIGPTPRRHAARQAVVDLKTSISLYPESREEAWFYALVVLLRAGTPPHSSIVYSIPSGTWHPQPRITEETLVAAARRVIDGVRKIVEIADGRKPTLTPNIATYCKWCPVAGSCPAYHREVERMGNT